MLLDACLSQQEDASGGELRATALLTGQVRLCCVGVFALDLAARRDLKFPLQACFKLFETDLSRALFSPLHKTRH